MDDAVHTLSDDPISVSFEREREEHLDVMFAVSSHLVKNTPTKMSWLKAVLGGAAFGSVGMLTGIFLFGKFNINDNYLLAGVIGALIGFVLCLVFWQRYMVKFRKAVGDDFENGKHITVEIDEKIIRSTTPDFVLNNGWRDVRDISVKNGVVCIFVEAMAHYLPERAFGSIAEFQSAIEKMKAWHQSAKRTK